MRPTITKALAISLLALAVTALQSLAQSRYQPYTFSTLAGISPGSVDGTGSAARFSSPSGLAVDGAGNAYVADTRNHTIRKVTSDGMVTTLAGLAGVWDRVDGTGSDARFRSPTGAAVDSIGNLYVADSGNNTIRKVTPTGVVTTLAGRASSNCGCTDGMSSAALFCNLSGVAVDSGGNIYVADNGNDTIRKVTPAGAVTTLAGLAGSYGSDDGKGSAARFNNPTSVAVDNAGNVYVADNGNNTIRKLTSAGMVTTLAGLASADPGSADGTGGGARFRGPTGVAVDTAGNVYVADSGNDAVRKVTPAGVVTTLAGRGSIGSADAPTSDALFSGPRGVAVDGTRNVYVADYGNNTIRKVTATGAVTTLAGLAGNAGSTDGTGSAARFNGPTGVAVDGAGNVYVADTGDNTIRKGYPAPRILNSGPGFGFNGGQFGFTITGPTGRLVIVEASTDLTSWLPIWTNTFAGALNFGDPQSGVSSNRFYRAHTP